MILHIDMDAFFASVEQRDTPYLRGKPIVVSGHSKRSVVSTASYEARQYGIRSAMPVFQAKQRCPGLIIVQGNRKKYCEDSARIMDILGRFSPRVEPVSIDEAYLDVQGCEKLLGPPQTIARNIKQTIWDTLSLTCSIGIAPVKFLAKIASDMEKPNGLTVISRDRIPAVIQALPIARVPGVGKKSLVLMDRLRIRTLGDVARIDPDLLTRKLGKMGHRLFELSQGIDPAQVSRDHVRKSISSETTLATDITDPKRAAEIILGHAQQVGRDLRRKNWVCRNVSIKLKFSDFTQITRQKKADTWICSSNAIFDEAMALFHKVVLKKKLRLIGVGVSHFQDRSAPMQMSLLPDPRETSEARWSDVDRAVDAISEKFGCHAVKKAALSAPHSRPGRNK